MIIDYMVVAVLHDKYSPYVLLTSAVFVFATKELHCMYLSSIISETCLLSAAKVNNASV